MELASHQTLPTDEESDHACDVAPNSGVSGIVLLEISNDTHSNGMSVTSKKCPADCPARCRRSWIRQGDLGRGLLEPHVATLSACMLLPLAARRSSMQPLSGHTPRIVCFKHDDFVVLSFITVEYRIEHDAAALPSLYDDKQCIILQRPDTGSPPPIFTIPPVTGPWAISLCSWRGEPGQPTWQS